MQGKYSDTVRLTLQLRVAGEPISGVLEGDEGATREFSGLLELVSLLDSLRHASPQWAEAPTT